MDTSESILVRENFIEIFCNRAKTKNLGLGDSPRLGWLVVRFSQIGPLTKYAPLIFNCHSGNMNPDVKSIFNIKCSM